MEQTAESNEQPTLPPYPDALFDWSNDEKDYLTFKGVPEDKLGRAQFKLWHVWVTWAALRNNEKLIELICKISPKDSEKHFLKEILVSTMDRLAKILSATPIMEELV